MKDPTQELYDAVKTALGSSITYSGKVLNVGYDMPVGTKSLRNVWLKDFSYTDDFDDSNNIVDGLLTIEVLVSGFKHDGNQKVINTATNKILQLLIDNKLSMTNFDMVVPFYADNVSGERFGNSADITERKIITLRTKIQEK